MRKKDADVTSRLAGQTGLWRAAVEASNDERAKLNALIIEAKKAGLSYADLRQITGIGNSALQALLAKAGL